MKLNSPEKLLVIALALLLGQNAGAGQLLPAAAGDRIPPAPQSSKVLLDSTLERAPVALSWKIDASAPIESNSPAFRAESREFWIEVSARQLQDGLDFTTTASGAVIRISPVLAMRSAPVDPRQLRLSRDGVDLDATTAIASVLRTEDRSEGSESFPEGSSAFRLAASAGSGRFTVRSAQASGSYVVHVFDVDSSVTLSAQAERDTWFVGENFAAAAQLQGSNLARLQGLISGPDGNTQSVSVSSKRDGSQQLSATLNLPALGASRGLYELHAWAAAGTDGSVLRDVRTAFALAAPSARLDGQYSEQAVRGALGWEFGVVVGQTGRYQLDGVLYVDGRPYAAAQSAAWLEAGSRKISLNFDANLFEAGRPGNYELRDFRLTDQGQLVTLEKRALVLSSASDSKH